MRVSFPKTVGATAGWLMLAFLIGVAIHSLWFRWSLPPPLWSAMFVIFILLVASLPSRTARVMACIVFAVCLGAWRFEIAPRKTVVVTDGRWMVVSRASSTANPLVRWRQVVTARIASALPHDEASLVAGILYGGQDLSADQKNMFRTSGLMHIVAVSGSNVTIVVQTVTAVLLSFGVRKRRGFWIVTTALILFTGFVGFSASVLRAAFMGWLMLLARMIGRLPSPFRLLLVAACILVIVDPWQLMFDAGFALSFLAMWGLLAWTPVLEPKLAWIPERFGMRETVCMTVAATLMTTPYSAWAFQRTTLAGLFSNILVMPLVPFVMGSGVVVAVWGRLPGFVLVAAPALGLAQMIEWIAKAFGSIPWLQIEIVDMELSTVVGMYVLIVFFWFLLRAKNGLSTVSRKKSGS